MARKYSRTRRFQPTTERALFKSQQMSLRPIDRTDLLDAIRGGEDSYIEFKVRFSNPEKLAAGICALANCGGGTMVFGVSDQLRLEGINNPELVEEDLLGVCRDLIVPPVWGRIDKVAFDSGLRLVVFEVDSRRAPHRTVDGRYYIRVGSTKREATGEEVAELYREFTGAHGYENAPLRGSNVATDIDEGEVWGFVNELQAGVSDLPPSYEISSLLSEMRLATSYSETAAPTVAGILLFGRGVAVAKRLSNSPLIARRVSGAETDLQVVEEVEFVGNLAGQHDRALQFISRYTDLWDTRPRKRRASPIGSRPYLPREPVIEAVTNAILHRDYAHRDHVRITIYDDRLEVENPSQNLGLTRRSLELGVREAINPRMKAIFTHPAYGANLVSGGVPMMLAKTKEFSAKNPMRLHIGPDTFRVEIPAW